MHRLLRSAIQILILLTAYTSIQATEQAQSSSIEGAILAGGCFWCLEADFEKLDGVIDVVSGYSGGHIPNPSYKQVSSGGSGHIEVVKINYDSNIINYRQILDYFWRNIDPTRDDGQFCDRGRQYRPAIFYANETQKKMALASKTDIQASKPFKQDIKVELIQAATFYPAEQYHQDYYKKNPLRYRYYRFTCRRDARLQQLWGQ